MKIYMVSLFPRATIKKRDAQKKRSSHKAVESVLRPGRESMVGKACERGRCWAGSERERELWMVRVVSWQTNEHEQSSQRQRDWNEVDGGNYRELITEIRWGIPKGTIRKGAKYSDLSVCMYTVFVRSGASLLLSLTLPNANRFSKFIHP